jgi:phosphoserine phosphatase RsbU/P
MDTAGSDVPGWARLDSPLLRQIQAAIIATDLDGVIQWCNPYAEDFFGRPASELIGHNSADFAGAEVTRDLAREIFEALRAGRTWEGDFSVVRKDGSILTAHVIDSPLQDDEGRLVGVASMSLDLTARRRAETRLRVQYELARTLGEARSLEEAIPRLLRPVCDALGWDIGAVWGLDMEGPGLRCVATWRSPESETRAFEELTAQTIFRKGVGIPGRVWATGRPEWIPDVVHDPNFTRAAVAAEVGIHGGFAVPIRRGSDVLGVMEFFASEVIREPDTELLEMMDAVGSQVGQFIERTEAERALRSSREGLARLAHTLQQSLLPPHLPSIPGVEIAAHYEAAGEGFDVGGDFYDVFETARNDWAVVIGDVCGKGPEAAALTALVRYTTRAAAIQTRRPRLVLDLVNEAVLRHDPEQFCTVTYVRLRPEGEGARLTVSCAGHPPPLVLRADGNVESVAAPGRVLGPFAELGAVDRIVTLELGDAVVVYTDGVTDARGTEGFFGDERLRDTLRSCAASSADDTVKTIERALRDFHGGRPRDDIALVVLRIPG